MSNRHSPAKIEESVRLIAEVVKALAETVAANEKHQRRFRIAAALRLARIEAILFDVQGKQLADSLRAEKVTKEELAKFARDIHKRFSKRSHDVLIEMVKFIYDGDQPPLPRHDRRRRWSGWEI